MEIKDKTLISFHTSDTRHVNGKRVLRIPKGKGIEKIGDGLFDNFIKEQKEGIKNCEWPELAQVFQTRLDMIDEIEEIILPDSVTSIGERAFKGLKNLTSIKLPAKLENIGSKAFYGCENLQEVFIPKTIKAIGKSAFEKCDGLEKVFLPRGLKIDKGDIFWDCSHVEFFRYQQELDKTKIQEEEIDPHTVLSTDSLFYQNR